MLTLSIIGYSIILLYTLYCILKCKCVPQSISASVYALNEGNKWIFSLVMVLVGFMIAPYLFESVTDSTKFLVWFIIIGLFGVGADPLTEGKKNTIHYVSAILSGVFSQALILFNSPWILLLWGLYVPYTLIWEYSGNNMFFAEMIMITGLMLLSYA